MIFLYTPAGIGTSYGIEYSPEATGMFGLGSKFLGDLECSTDEENIFNKNECEDEENSDGEDG